MKRFASLILLFTLIAAPAFAADGGSGKIRLDSSARVGATISADSNQTLVLQDVPSQMAGL
jgi:hypothetical protein